MKTVHISGKTQRILKPTDEHCPHLHTWKIARRYTTQIVGPISTTFYTCLDCHEALQNEIAQNFILCNDCRKPMAPEEVVGWSPYDHTPSDPTIYLCSECVCGVKHLDRIEYDRATYSDALTVKQRQLAIESFSAPSLSIRFIPPAVTKVVDKYMSR